MGVKSLWGILSSSGETISIGSLGEPVLNSPTKNNSDIVDVISNLNINGDVPTKLSSVDIGHSFAGKAVAIDLSCWVCDSQANASMYSVTKPHLRNLLFRTWSLLNVGVLPIFVVEGKAPELKQATMKARNATRNGGSASGEPIKTKKATRNKFDGVLRECCEFFKLVGVPFIQATGEAEATCAALFYHKIVSGVITEDSDVFLYGGDCVLRNFAVQTNKPTAEIFSFHKFKSDLHLSRESLVVLSLLLGCDYLPSGVTGVGVSSAIRLMTHWGHTSLCALDRFLSWKNFKIDDSAKISKFKKNGDMLDLEAAIRDRTIRTDGFPFTDIIDEFLHKLPVPQGTDDKNISWKQPSADKLLSWCMTKLNWEEDYALPKVIQFCGRWLICHRPTLCHISTSQSIKMQEISGKCTRGGVPCYHVLWDVSEASGSVTSSSSIEPKHLLANNRFAEEFEDRIESKKKGKGKKKETGSISSGETKVKRVVKEKKKVITGKKTLEDKQLLLKVTKTKETEAILTLQIPGNSDQGESNGITKKVIPLNVMSDSDKNYIAMDDEPGLKKRIQNKLANLNRTPITNEIKPTNDDKSDKFDEKLTSDISHLDISNISEHFFPDSDCPDSDSSDLQEDLSFIVDRFINMNIGRKKCNNKTNDKRSDNPQNNSDTILSGGKENSPTLLSRAQKLNSGIEPKSKYTDFKDVVAANPCFKSILKENQSNSSTAKREADKTHDEVSDISGNICSNEVKQIRTIAKGNFDLLEDSVVDDPKSLIKSGRSKSHELGFHSPQINGKNPKVINNHHTEILSENVPLDIQRPCFSLLDSSWLDGEDNFK